MVNQNSVKLCLRATDVNELQETELKECSTMTLTSCTSLFIDMMVDVSTHAPILAHSTWLGMAKRQERKSRIY
jgi:hypothetical protein